MRLFDESAMSLNKNALYMRMDCVCRGLYSVKA